MAVEAELGVVGKVRAELQKERSKVLVHAIEVIVVDHPCRLHDPGIARARALTSATLGPHDARLFLRLADIQHALVLLELPQVLLGDIVLALALLEGNEIKTFAGDELFNVVNECLGHRRHGRCGGKALAPVNLQVSQHAAYRLQGRHIDVEIHPVDRLVLKHHMITYYVRHGSCYRHRGLRSSTGPRTHRASSSYIQGMSLEARPESTGERPQSPISSAHVVPIYLVGLSRSLVSLGLSITRAVLAHSRPRARRTAARRMFGTERHPIVGAPVMGFYRLTGLRGAQQPCTLWSLQPENRPHSKKRNFYSWPRNAPAIWQFVTGIA